MVDPALLGGYNQRPKRVELAVFDHLDSPDGEKHGQPHDLVLALLCDAYPFLTERYATAADGMLDVARLVRMRAVMDLYRTVESAVRKPPRIQDKDGRWRSNWTDHEKTTMDRLMQLRRERDNG
jgi:hypothetical protein